MPGPAGGAALSQDWGKNSNVTDQPSVALSTLDGVGLRASFWPAQDRRLGAVVAHGFTGSSRHAPVKRICTALAAAGAAVLAPDLRGHGRSGGLSTAGDLEVHDVAAAVAWLRAGGYERVAVLGWSMGGSIVLRYAGLGGDADAVVSVSSPGEWYERGTRAMRVVHWLCETRSGRLTCRVVRRTRLSPQGWVQVPESPAEVVGRIAPTPLLIVHGDADHYFPIRHVDVLAAAAPGATVWVEHGMAHAETATTPQLVERIATWVRTAALPVVWDDGARD
ncbi:MAG: alpha/beta hydrolase [Pseudonocardiales bacterium]|nr:MAG: alpha/beta hydrolase [Pseudonocardiales bacterium]